PAATGEVARPAPRHAMAVLIFFSAAATVVAAAIGAHLPALVLASGATAEQALLAASLMGPAQVAARLLQFGPLRRLHPLALARLACLAQLCGGLALLFFGAPAAIAFVLLFGAGNGMQTIAKGTLPLAVFGPAGYGGRQGLIAAPGRVLQAGTPVGFGLLLAAWGMASTAAIAAVALAALLSLLLLSHRGKAGAD
ncbi:MFS transporter, partial [Roseomonas ludipueritiae]|nr:MFS transporter [Pseudoroseomonas ludipueritiae]